MKCYYLTLLIVVLFRATAFGQIDTGQSTSNTPYDQYLGPMRQTYLKLSGEPASIDEVRSLMRTARRFRYYFDAAKPYVPQLPQVTEAKRTGDCKAKSLWLISKMGDPKARYVIGKGSRSSAIAHAWLLWCNGGTWYILDPTNEFELMSADRVVGRKCIPRYSYKGFSSYRHPTYSQYFKE